MDEKSYNILSCYLIFIYYMSKYSTILLWIILTIISLTVQDIALFIQTKDFMVHDSLISKIITNEFFATILWMCAIPATRLGFGLFGAIKLTMMSYLFLFGGQIISNYMWLNEPTTVDDYISIVVVIFGLLISTFKVFG